MSADGEPQPASARLARVGERLTALGSHDAALADALDEALSSLSTVPDRAIDKDPAGAVRDAANTLREPVAAELSALVRTTPGVTERARPERATVSQTLQIVYVHAGSAHAAAVALFQTGRLMLVGAACDLALERIKTYRSASNALNALLPQVVAWELRDEGLPCHCVCPMCGLGLCGCIWASLHNIDIAVAGAGVAPDERGIPLRSPPRPGSQLAAAAVHQWDRVVSVDDEQVRTVPELETALRRHAIGDDVRLGLTRDGERRELVVKHISDFT